MRWMCFLLASLSLLAAPERRTESRLKDVARLQGVAVDTAQYQRKRDLLCSLLKDLGYSFVRPEGAFYLFPRSPVEDDVQFVHDLLQERILVVPGSGFGRSGHFRIAYCVDDAVITGAADGFSRVAKKYGLR